MNRPQQTGNLRLLLLAAAVAGGLAVAAGAGVARADDQAAAGLPPPSNTMQSDTYPLTDPYASIEHSKRLDSIRQCLAEGRISLDVAQAMANAENAARSDFNQNMDHVAGDGAAQGQMVRQYIEAGGARQ